MQLEHQITVFLCLLHALLLEPLGWWEQDWGGEASSGSDEDAVYSHTPAHLNHVWESQGPSRCPPAPPLTIPSPGRGSASWGSHHTGKSWKAEVRWDLTLKGRNVEGMGEWDGTWQIRGYARVGTYCCCCWKNADILKGLKRHEDAVWLCQRPWRGFSR